MRERTEECTHKGVRWGEGVDDRAVTTYSMDDMYFTAEGNAKERDAGEGTVRGSTTLRRPIIVGMDKKTGGVHAHQLKMQGLGLRQELQQTLLNWDTEDQKLS